MAPRKARTSKKTTKVGKVEKVEEVKPVKEAKRVPQTKTKGTTTKRGRRKGKEAVNEDVKEIADDPEPSKVVKVTKKANKKASKNTANNVSEAVSSPAIKDSILDKAASELKKWSQRQVEQAEQKSSKRSLFEQDDEDLSLYLQATSGKFFAKKPTLKPKAIRLAHTVHNLDEFKICLFVKDGSIDEKLLSEIEAEEIPNLSKIIPANELKTTYKTFETRRRLASEYDMFLSDDNIVTILPKLLGKIFYGNSKYPIPIRIGTKEEAVSIVTLKSKIEKAVNSVYYIPPTGVNLSIKIGRVDQDSEKLRENVHLIVEHLAKFPIRMVQLKMTNSPAIPVYISEKIYDEGDVVDDEAEVDRKELEDDEEEVDLGTFEKGLIELAVDEDEAKEIIGERKRKHEEAIKEKESARKETLKKAKTGTKGKRAAVAKAEVQKDSEAADSQAVKDDPKEGPAKPKRTRSKRTPKTKA
ncbi:DEKNAAC105483 [Brettanomyces naardenensis]|uniref:DEKNAAC105483 n=1 Tax=Brettanomyces naardenensis TaxID=13370 RepID=A0A448YTD0_BRENA|nr:DEKNAAC105483 [Brettanomyces naardenensis]